MGKGSARRPGDEAAYRNGWDRVFGTTKKNLPAVAPECVHEINVGFAFRCGLHPLYDCDGCPDREEPR